jgi:hypothetical protein
MSQMTFRIPADPTDPHAEARAHVVSAIAAAAEMHGGRVTQNAVRTILAAVPEWDVPPHIVGATYRSLRLRGVLAYDGLTEVSDDVAGGNAGKIHRTYVWVGDPR